MNGGEQILYENITSAWKRETDKKETGFKKKRK